MAVKRTLLLGMLALAACSPDYSPNTYDTSAVQKANAVDQGVVVGVRNVDVTSQGTTGALTGGAAGGIAGSQLPGGGATSAFGALGGTLIGGLVGSSTEKVMGQTHAYEYIVRKSDAKLISVTQKDEAPMDVGQHVLVIAGAQARIVPDYTVPLPEPAKVEPPKPDAPKPEPAPVKSEPLAAPPSAPAAGTPDAATAPTPLAVPVPAQTPPPVSPSTPAPATASPSAPTATASPASPTPLTETPPKPSPEAAPGPAAS